MRISRIGLVVVGTMLALTACGDVDQTPVAFAQEGTTTAMNGISVSGRGEVFGTPDTLTVTIGISVGRSTVSEAVDVAAGRATDLIGAVEGLGVAEKDIQTSNYSIYPEYEYRENQTPRTGRAIRWRASSSAARRAQRRRSATGSMAGARSPRAVRVRSAMTPASPPSRLISSSNSCTAAWSGMPDL